MGDIVDAARYNFGNEKNIMATNVRQYERGMPYLFFIKSETKPMQIEIRQRIERMRTIYTDEDSTCEIHDTDGGHLGRLPSWPHHVIITGIIVCIEAL